MGVKSQNMPSRAKNCLKYTSLIETTIVRLSARQGHHTPHCQIGGPQKFGLAHATPKQVFEHGFKKIGVFMGSIDVSIKDVYFICAC